jgi:methionyl-tRNA formyltransferase
MHTGVTLQTLHPEKFDHGGILDQTPPPGFEIPNWPNCTYTELLDFITPKAAEMLVKGIRNRVFVDGAAKAEDNPTKDTNNTHPLRHACKITTEHRHVDWLSMQPEEILRLDRVLGRPWSLHQAHSGPPKRIIFSGLSHWPNFWSTVQAFKERNRIKEDDHVKNTFMSLLSRDGRLSMVPYVIGKDEIVMCTSAPGGAISIKEITIEGQGKMSAAKAMQQLEGDKAQS